MKDKIKSIADKYEFSQYMTGFYENLHEISHLIEKYINGEKIDTISPSIFKSTKITGNQENITREIIRDILYTLKVEGEIASCSTAIANELNSL